MAQLPTQVNLKTIGASLGAVVAILSSIWALNNHYASAEDVKSLRTEFGGQIEQLRQEKVDDELFRLDIKKQQQHGKLDPVDAAMYERYQRRSSNSSDKKD